MPLSTVSAVLDADRAREAARGSSRPSRRTATSASGPASCVHIDVKKLGRIGRRRPSHHRRIAGTTSAARRVGWEYVHVCVDDATRLAYVEVLDDEKADDRGRLPAPRGRATTAACGIQVERVMTDNGSAYRVDRCTRSPARELGIKHLRTRPYRPRTNGKAERFIRTMLGGWAYGAIYGTSDERRRALAGWLDCYNRRRPHRSLGHQPP